MYAYVIGLDIIFIYMRVSRGCEKKVKERERDNEIGGFTIYFTHTIWRKVVFFSSLGFNCHFPLFSFVERAYNIYIVIIFIFVHIAEL